jgi:glutamate-5-semialdehyde dehydrogenase
MLREKLTQLRKQAQLLRCTNAEVRSEMLLLLGDAVQSHREFLLSENQRDYAENSDTLDSASRQRLVLTDEKINALSCMLRELAHKPDPLGVVLSRTQLDQGLVLDKVAIPLGVFSVIFESRPDIFFQILGLALRTGNGVVLKGGREASRTNAAMMQIALDALAKASLPSEWFLLIEGREAIRDILQYDDLIDLVIPRGSNELVSSIKAQTKIPVLGHASGVCHLYIHSAADQQRALKIVIDAKTQYPAACNSVETVLVDSQTISSFLPQLNKALSEAGVTVRGCARTCSFLGLSDQVREDEWSREYGCLTLAIKIVDGLQQAIQHISEYGSQHTDGIVSENQLACEEFIDRVDSAGVYANCSTRFADGYRYGFGAEIGIGTGKLHARGPVGMEGLLSYKYVLRGAGHQVSDYSGSKAKPFLFKRLPTHS